MEHISSALEPLGLAFEQTYTALNNINYTDYLQSKTVQTVGIVALAVLAAVAVISGLSCLFIAIGPVCSSIIFACTLSALTLACIPSIIKSATKQYTTRSTQTSAPKTKNIGVSVKPKTKTVGITAQSKPHTKNTGTSPESTKHKMSKRVAAKLKCPPKNNTDHIRYPEGVVFANPNTPIVLPNGPWVSEQSTESQSWWTRWWSTLSSWFRF